MNGQPLVNVLNRAAERAKQLDTVRNTQSAPFAILEDILAVDAFHHQVELALIRASPVQKTGNVRMAESRQHLALAAEARDEIARLQAGPQDFHRDLLLELPVVALRPVNPAHAAAADFLGNPVHPDTATRPVVGVIVLCIWKEMHDGGSVDEVAVFHVCGEQFPDLPLQRFVGTADVQNVLLPVFRRTGEGCMEQVLNSLPLVRRHDQMA